MSVRASAVPAILLGALGLACAGKPAEGFRTDAVTQGPIVELVSATGEVQALVTVNVGSQVSGTISRLYVDFNSKVKKDQLLAELDPRLLRAQLARADAVLAGARADVERAQVTLNDAERTLKRQRELFASSLISQADVDTALFQSDSARASLTSAKAKVLQAKADRDLAATNLAFARITSPIDGIVVSRAIDVGQTVAASFQTPTLFTIANDLTKMQILANIDEADVGKVREGMEARFSVDAWPGENFRGSIREVRQAPSTIQNVVTYAAVIDAPNPERKLRQGMTAQVQVTSGKRDEALRVANAALRYRPANFNPAEAKPADAKAKDDKAKDDKTLASAGPPGERGAMGRSAGRGERGGQGGEKAPPEARKSRMGRVFKLQDGKPVAVQVRLGLSDSQRTEVLEGLAPGDLVVVGEAGSGPVPPGGLGGAARPGGGARRGF